MRKTDGQVSLQIKIILKASDDTNMIKYIDALVQERRNSSALAMELRVSYTNPSIWSSVQNTFTGCHTNCFITIGHLEAAETVTLTAFNAPNNEIKLSVSV